MNYVKSCVKDMINDYTNNPKRIRSDYNKEQEAIEIYRGRELLELIQNADDELLEGMGKEFRISFLNNILIISNNGSPFSEDGIDSLMYSNNSSKPRKKEVIGNKGTGFRAILGWADEIRIKSGDLNIRFSDEYAQAVLNEILKNSDKTKSNEQYRAATLVFPEWINTDVNSIYTTDVSIYIHKDDNIITDIIKQLDDIDGELLLFLNRTEELTVETKDKTVSFVKRHLDGDRIIIEKKVNGIVEDKQEWLMNRQNGEFEGKQYSIVIAYNLYGLKQKRQVLYSYFPTDVEFPFPVLLHANFILNSDRNHLTKNNQANRYILGQACKLLIDTALKLTKDEISYEALLVLAPQKHIPKELTDYGFEELLMEEIRHSKVFPTVNGEYISFDEYPKFYTSYLSQYLDGEGFENLLIHTENKTVCNLIKKLNNGYFPLYTFDEIVKKINKWAKSHELKKSTIEKHAYCAVGFLDDYEHTREIKLQKKMPLLIYDTESALVSNEKAVFLRDRNANISNPPAFAQIRFMHPEMRSIFEEITKVTGRNLANKLSSFGVKEYNTARIIEKMNSVIKRRLDASKIDITKKFCEQGLKWIWENRHILDSAGEKIRIYLITRNEEVRLSDELYIGIEYSNQICENLFKGLFEDKFVDDIRKYIATNESPDQEIIIFLQTLGVDKFPKQRIKKLYPSKEYKRKLLEGVNYPFTLEWDKFKDVEDMVSRVTSITAEVTVIDELEDILKKCDTQHIIEWIKEDSILSQILFTKREMSNGKVNIKWGLKQNYRYLPVDRIYAYIYWLFESIPWIEVNNKRNKMSECLLSKIGILLEPLLIEPDIDNYIKDIDGSKARIRNEYEYIFSKLGVESDFADLPIEKVYKVLNLLPEIQEGETIAKRFYATLIRSDRTITDNELKCSSFEKFMESGKVLCNTGYQNIKDAWYLDGKSICEKIANTYNLLEIPKRQNSVKIRKLLGVEKLNLKGEVVGNPEIHSDNLVFQRDFKLYKPLAFCYRIDNATKDEAKRFSELDIILCTNLTARYTDKEIELDDYDYILKDNKTFYIKVPRAFKSLDDMKRSVSFAAAIANVLCSFIDVADSFAAFRELYGASDLSRRELIHQIFEDDEIIDRAKTALNYSEDTKEEFIRIMAKCSGQDPQKVAELAKNIDFDNFTAIYNAKPIIDCFRQLNLDVDIYNAELPSTQIDLYNYYQTELTKLLPQYENMYKLHHFYRLKGKSLEEKKKLVDLFLNYDFIQPKISNSVLYDSESELIKHLGIKIDIEIIDLISLYNTNYSTWKKGLNNTDYIDQFLSISSNMSCMYYGEYDKLNKAYTEFVDLQLAYDEEIEDNKDDEVIEPEVLYPTTNPTPQAPVINGKRTKITTGHTSPKNLEQIGLNGEKIVYEMLKKQYSSIKWVSENAKILGINPEGRSGLGYDIEYVDENGNRIYIEVKASKTSEVVFYMSQNEFDFAIKHIPEYKIYYVSEVLSKKPKILILDNVFKDNDFNSKNYALDMKKEYKIMATIS